jgi:hypothetical protein
MKKPMVSNRKAVKTLPEWSEHEKILKLRRSITELMPQLIRGDKKQIAKDVNIRLDSLSRILRNIEKYRDVYTLNRIHKNMKRLLDCRKAFISRLEFSEDIPYKPMPNNIPDKPILTEEPVYMKRSELLSIVMPEENASFNKKDGYFKRLFKAIFNINQ